MLNSRNLIMEAVAIRRETNKWIEDISSALDKYEKSGCQIYKKEVESLIMKSSGHLSKIDSWLDKVPFIKN